MADPCTAEAYTPATPSPLGRRQIHTPHAAGSSHPISVQPTVVFDAYWRFAAERLAIYYRRLRGSNPPWTTDPILTSYRFTNTYRAADRVSQYLIREIQYHPHRPATATEVFFRTMLFKVFNRIETWERLERVHGPLTWNAIDLLALNQSLSDQLDRGERIYSPAYIIPAPRLGAKRKHTNHLKLISMMIHDRLPDRLQQMPSLASVYETLLTYPGLGPFLSFQYAIDLNYSTLLDFAEGDLVVAGPGAIDGISKCFRSTAGLSPESIIHYVTERQNQEFLDRGIDFPGLFGRPLQPIDCQNVFCEISKYSRVAYPEFAGRSNRRRIKQVYNAKKRPLPEPLFPPRWELVSLGLDQVSSDPVEQEEQPRLF